MSMQRQRDRAQDLLRIIDVGVEKLTKQASKGADLDAALALLLERGITEHTRGEPNEQTSLGRRPDLWRLRASGPKRRHTARIPLT